MKKVFLMIGMTALLTGCSWLKESFSEKIHGPSYKEWHVKMPAAEVYEAALATTKQMGFVFVSGGPAQGKLEARTRVETDRTLNGARQVLLKAKFMDDQAGGTLVSALFTEVQEDNSNKVIRGATEQGTSDRSLYENFFRGIQRVKQDGMK